MMTVEHDDCMNNQLTSKAAGYSANHATFVTDLIHQELQQFVNHMPIFQQEQQNDENIAPNKHPASDNTNAALSTDALKDILRMMMKEHQKTNRNDRNGKVKPKAQGKDDDGKELTYCHSHGITSNLWHNSTTCTRKKEGHKEAATLDSKLGGNTERCKPWRK
jgi:hypothetical protein